jgi:hypothetical protein
MRQDRCRPLRLARSLALVAALALAPSMGCAALSDPLNRGGDFRDTQQRFTQYVRWGDFNRASEFVHPEQREQFLALAPELSEIRFTDYEIRDVQIGEGVRQATADVRYTGYRLSGLIERHVDVRQEWERDPSGWRVRMDLDRIRQALDGRAP